MKWSLLSQGSHHDIYQLNKEGKQVLQLQYQPRIGSLRLIINDDKRVFLVTRGGFIKQKTVLRNEYGLKLAQFINSGQPGNGLIEFSDEKLLFSYKSTLGELQFFKLGTTREFFSCKVDKEISQALLPILALVLAWFSYSTQKELAV